MRTLVAILLSLFTGMVATAGDPYHPVHHYQTPYGSAQTTYNYAQRAYHVPSFGNPTYRAPLYVPTPSPSYNYGYVPSYSYSTTYGYQASASTYYTAPTYSYYPAVWWHGRWYPAGRYAWINGCWSLEGAGPFYGYDAPPAACPVPETTVIVPVPVQPAPITQPQPQPPIQTEAQVPNYGRPLTAEEIAAFREWLRQQGKK